MEKERPCCVSFRRYCYRFVRGAAPAQAVEPSWPSKPIRFIVPFPAGAVTDLVARIVASKLGERLGQTVYVDNRPGASGNLGAEALARAAPDGYTIGLAIASTHAIAASLNASLPYDPVKDFAPVSMIGDAPYVLVVNSKLPAHNVAELIQLAKTKPRSLNYSTVGPASLAQFAGALFSKMAGVELTEIPYRTATHAALDLAEGRIEMQFGAVAASLGFVRQGTVRALAVTSKARVQALPDFPTMEEAGLSGYDFDRLHSRQHDDEVQLLGFDLLELDGTDLRREPVACQAERACDIGDDRCGQCQDIAALRRRAASLPWCRYADGFRPCHIRVAEPAFYARGHRELGADNE